MTRYPRSGKGRKWTTLELKAIPAAWKGGTISDGEGLIGEVRVTTAGAVSIRFKYAFKWQGKVSWHQCGTWPLLGLEIIRRERDEARERVRQGINPNDQKKADRIEAQAKVEATLAEAERRRTEDCTWREMYNDWIAHGVLRANDNAEIKQGFDKHLLPTLGEKPVRTLDAKALTASLRVVGIDLDHPRTAEKLASQICQMYGWAAKRQPWRGLMKDGNPADLLEPKGYLPKDYKSEPCDRVLSPQELVELRDKLAGMETAYADAPAGKKYAVPRPLKKEAQLALWISLGTACRIGELLKARWANIDLQAPVRGSCQRPTPRRKRTGWCTCLPSHCGSSRRYTNWPARVNGAFLRAAKGAPGQVQRRQRIMCAKKA